MTVNSPLTDLKGIGPELAKKYALLGLHTVGELIDNFPRRYDDYSVATSIADIRPGLVTITARIHHATTRYIRRGMQITEAIAGGDDGSVKLVWFNQPYRAASIKADQDYFISGVYELKSQRFSITNPSLELATEFPLNTARIVPIYRETKGLVSRQIRQALNQVLPVIATLTETLPVWLRDERGLMQRSDAILGIHFPDSSEHLQTVRRRLGFEEVFELTLAALMNKRQHQQEISVTVPFEEQIARKFVASLPFSLTNAQRRVGWQIFLDMERVQPMNRLVEGDVGSGKTVVAAMAAVMAMSQGWQTVLMAPTELLARQHADTLYTLLQPLKLDSSIILLVGSQKKLQKDKARAAIASGQAKLMIGTQALIQDSVEMHKLALVIIDEQHRFGVDQRQKLQVKAGHMPHVLSLTATPIPRSLALTLYGELDVSVLAEKPKGREPITTEIVSPNSRKQLYAKIDDELAAGRQMFVVCPLISVSTSLKLRSAEEVFKEMKTKDFKHRRVGLLHGKLKADEKQLIMQQFVRHELDILVATTVIEVGVDVPNASIMLIEGAERFGLAQAHQLRGRVGRGSDAGYCYLMLSDSKPPSRRLRALETSQDGFKLAELDLELRGPGAIYGTMQHGQLDLRIAKLSDTELIADARTSAQEFLDGPNDLLQYPELLSHVNRLRSLTNLN
ncbi:ATP-dependent DNA helicase RecG [Candidatus Saccharibacteria bacterium]|nr:ATP-dependent DNA helicase RecG [Candidatus Saccharibacteria bacterium]